MTTPPAAPATTAIVRRPSTCQFCLADCRNTPVATHLPQEQRCPVCGAAYNGPRRDAEYRALLDAGLVDAGDVGPVR